MFTFYKQRSFKKRVDFPINYFLQKSLMSELITQGFLCLKGVFNDDDFVDIDNKIKDILNIPEVSSSSKFLNSGRIDNPIIRTMIMDLIKQFSQNNLQKIFDTDCFDINTTGAFQIKPPGINSELNPHQDSPVIDESLFNGLYVWIPLVDINEKNGPVYVLPNSHTWGNHQRSLNVKWPFEKYIKVLKKHMIPVFCNRGDVIVWDTALIHSSSPNLSNKHRVAFTTTLLPVNFQMMEYFKDKKTPKNKVEKYRVFESFWKECDILKRPPVPPNEFICLEDYLFEKINRSDLDSFLSY